MRAIIIQNLHQLRNNKLFRDASWAVVGNGMANALLLIAGIIIARMLGRDMYGQYGYVKTTMLTVSGVVTFGLGITSTRYVARMIESDPDHIKELIRDAQRITIAFSGTLGTILFITAPWVAKYLDGIEFSSALRMLACLIVIRAIITTQNGILSGLKKFDSVARNNIASGLLMIVTCVPLTYIFNLNGALVALLLSQVTNCMLNYFSIREQTKAYHNYIAKNKYIKELLKFSFPVALQDFSYTLFGILEISLLAKLSTIGEVGLYTASAQWNAVVLMIPSLLGNIILSYLSGTAESDNKHNHIFNMMLMANFICTIIPFFIVVVASDIIVSMYGPSFAAMKGVLIILVISAIFECCASVFRCEFIAMGKVYVLTCVRIIRDILRVLAIYIVLSIANGKNGAMNYSIVMVVTSALNLSALAIMYYIFPKRNLATK